MVVWAVRALLNRVVLQNLNHSPALVVIVLFPMKQRCFTYFLFACRRMIFIPEPLFPQFQSGANFFSEIRVFILFNDIFAGFLP